MYFKRNQKTTNKQIRQLSVNQTNIIEIQIKNYLSCIFSKNQLDLIITKEKKHIGQKNTISKILTLR